MNELRAAPDTILLIHGLWMTPRSWEHWQAHYEAAGYTVLAPAWPGMEAEVEALNRDPSPIARQNFPQIVAHYEDILRALPSPPIIMGHSTGGTVMQLLLDRGWGAAGVGIGSATVKGVRDLPLSTIRATFPALRNPFRQSPAPLSAAQFHYAFTNTLTRQESDAIYRRYHVPCATGVLRDLAFSNLKRQSPLVVDFNRPSRPPLLFVAFEHDHIVPPNASRHNAEKYGGPSNVGFYVFPGRPHFPGAPGWEQVADHALTWSQQQTAQPAGTSAPAAKRAA
jgi:pimeloyl-ACP methyl ester carboxylesterase